MAIFINLRRAAMLTARRYAWSEIVERSLRPRIHASVVSDARPARVPKQSSRSDET